ncbi:MAG: hypothetical protein ACSHX6_10055 [Akkermansiaceae bacterium]
MNLINVFPKIILSIALFFTVISSQSEVLAQENAVNEKPLTLVEIKALLQAENGKSLEEKNANVLKLLAKRGTSFGLTIDIKMEIRAAGGNDTLVDSIRIATALEILDNEKKAIKPSFKIDSITTDSDVTYQGQKGVFIHASFTAIKLKDSRCAIVHTFKTSATTSILKDIVVGQGPNYKNKYSEMRPRRYFTPKEDSQVYNKFTTFVPYSEFKLDSPKSHTLYLRSSLIIFNHFQTTNFEPVEFKVNLPKQPAPEQVKLSIDSEYISILSEEVKDGQKGILIKTRLTAHDLKGVSCHVVYTFKARDFTVEANDSAINKQYGQLIASTQFTPESQIFKIDELTTFVPYNHFKLKKIRSYTLLTTQTFISKGKELVSDAEPYSTSFMIPRTTDANAPKPAIVNDRTWIDLDVIQGNDKGIHIHTSFTAKNLAGIGTVIFHRIKDGTEPLIATGRKYSFMGKLAPSLVFTPKTNSEVYEKLTTFVPYSAFQLEKPKTHMLTVLPKVIIAGEDEVGDLKPRAFLVNLPKDNVTTDAAEPKAQAKEEIVINKIWYKHDVTENGKKGMTVHVKLNAKNLKDTPILLQVHFSNKDGILKAKTPIFSTKAGQTSLNRKITPKFDASEYEDIPMFIPYEEFGLGFGAFVITMEAKVTTFKESTPLSEPNKTAFILNLKL